MQTFCAIWYYPGTKKHNYIIITTISVLLLPLSLWRVWWEIRRTIIVAPLQHLCATPSGLQVYKFEDAMLHAYYFYNVTLIQHCGARTLV